MKIQPVCGKVVRKIQQTSSIGRKSNVNTENGDVTIYQLDKKMTCSLSIWFVSALNALFFPRTDRFAEARAIRVRLLVRPRNETQKEFDWFSKWKLGG